MYRLSSSYPTHQTSRHIFDIVATTAVFSYSLTHYYYELLSCSLAASSSIDRYLLLLLLQIRILLVVVVVSTTAHMEQRAN